MVCQYCSTYQQTEIRTKEGRFCAIKSKTVSGGQTCERFTLNPLFWCNRHQQWLDVVVCKNRRFMRKEGCINCSQWKQFSTSRTRNEGRRSRND